MYIVIIIQCVIDGKFARADDACIKNPKFCTNGLSFSIWEKVFYARDIIDLHPEHDKDAFDKKYIFSTGADFDVDLKKTVPGFALYHQGLDVTAVVSTGEDVWSLTVRGTLVNQTWTSYGIIWTLPDLDESKILHPTERGGLELYFNLEKVGHAVLPVPRPDDGAGNAVPWTEEPPLSLPALDPAGNPIPGAVEGPAVMMFGCQYEQMEEGQAVAPPKFDHFHEAIFDEMAIWTRKLNKNKTHDETLYFLGGYVEELEEMTPEKFAEMLKAVDMTDPDQAAAAGSMTATLLSNQKPDSDSGSGGGGGGGGSSGGSGGGGSPAATQATPISGGGGGKASAISVVGVQQLPWKEKKKYKQLALAETYAELLSMAGAVDGSLPKHLDSRFRNIQTAAKMLSCEPENVERWKIVLEDDDLAGASEYVEKMEEYALAYMASANISFYDNTDFFDATTGEYVVHLPTDELYMSVQKMGMDRFRMRGHNYDVGAYRYPPGKWDSALQNWDSPVDKIVIPTEMYADVPECLNNPVTFLYAIYPCYGEYAPLRRNPVTITSKKFVLDSKVITVRFLTNNDTFNPTKADAAMCKDIPVDLKYSPVKVKLYHKSKETARRKILHHEEEIKTSIDTRRCVMWNPDIGMFGAWDAEGCTTVMSEQDSTTCECKKFGTYALAAEKIERPEGHEDYTWLLVSRYIGFSVSIISLLIFVIIIVSAKHLWEMFHLMRLNTGICYLFAMIFHFLSELEQIREDRHLNATVSSLILFFYLSGSYFQLMEAFAEFRAITAGIVGGKTWAYIPFGWGAGFIGLGYTWFEYGMDVGTDPNVFIGWENETKMPFLIMNYAALVVSEIIIHLFIYLSIYLSKYISIHIYLSKLIYLSVYLSIRYKGRR